VRTHPARSGFLLLEVIPGLLILAAILLLATRMLWLESNLREKSSRREGACASFPLVLERWENSIGLAAMVVETVERELEILEFPDDTWFPPDAELSGETRSLWRRRILNDADGWSWWEIEYRTIGMPDWRWQGRVLRERIGGSR